MMTSAADQESSPSTWVEPPVFVGCGRAAFLRAGRQHRDGRVGSAWVSTGAGRRKAWEPDEERRSKRASGNSYRWWGLSKKVHGTAVATDPPLRSGTTAFALDVAAVPLFSPGGITGRVDSKSGETPGPGPTFSRRQR